MPTNTDEKTRPKTLLLRGPVGSGKSTLAKHIAEVTGRYLEMTIFELSLPFSLAPLADYMKTVGTIIIEEYGGTKLEAEILGALIEKDKVVVNVLGKSPVTKTRPNVIICMTNTPGTAQVAPLVTAGDGRILVVDVAGVEL